jgi:hypothetical protein
MPEQITPWVVCNCCEDFLCTVHEEHVYDCPCPVIDDWQAAGLWPYDACDEDHVMNFLRANNGYSDTHDD